MLTLPKAEPIVVAKHNQMCRERRVAASAFSNNMHSIVTRLNNGSAFLSTCVMVLLVAIALTTFLFNPTLQGDLTISSINVFVRFMILNCGWFYKKSIAFPLKHDDTPIVNKISPSLISILPQVCRILPRFLSDETQILYGRSNTSFQLEHKTSIFVSGSGI